MGDNLSWDLGELVSYTAGQELECKVTFLAPQDGTYYLIGALYTTDLVYISGTLFGVNVVEGYGINSPSYMTTWALGEDTEIKLDCKFTLDRTNVILGLFLRRIVGTEPSLTEDEEVDSITVSLSGPAAAIDITQLMTMAIVVGMMGMMMATALKD